MLLLAGIFFGMAELPSARAQRQREMQADPLFKEFGLIGKPDFATQVGTCSYGAKGWQQRVYSCDFAASTDFSEILRFYASELPKYGWVTVRADLPGFAYWCKGGNQATLQRGSIQTTSGESYSLDLSHGVPPAACKGTGS